VPGTDTNYVHLYHANHNLHDVIAVPHYKPMIIAETSALYTEDPLGGTNTEEEIKTEWIRQVYNLDDDDSAILDEDLYEVHCINWFSIYKYERHIFRVVDWQLHRNADVIDYYNSRVGDNPYFIKAIYPCEKVKLVGVPKMVEPAGTYSIDVDYETFAARDIIVSLVDPQNGYVSTRYLTSYGSATGSVAAGSGTLTLDVTLDGTAGLGSYYAWNVILVLPGGDYNGILAMDREEEVTVTVIDHAVDTDADGLPDWWEQEFFGDISSQDGQGNPDGDEFSNLYEYRHGTVPTEVTVPSAERQLAILEPPEGCYFGVALNFEAGDMDPLDSVERWTNRMNGLRAAAYEYFTGFPFTEEDEEKLQDFVEQVIPHQGIAIITLRPMGGLETVTQQAVDNLAQLCAQWEAAGIGGIMLRFGNEMNSSWFPWGQQPTLYKQKYRMLANAIHAQTERTAMIWDPNEGKGYPYPLGPYLIHHNQFVAFNDLSWAGGQSEWNITRYTTDSGAGTPPEGSSGCLKDFVSGVYVPAQLTVTGGNWDGAGHTTQGSNPEYGTDGFSVFTYDGDFLVDATGVVSYGPEDLVLKFSNLPTDLVYNVVIYGDAGDSEGTNDLTLVTLTGAEAFCNYSTPEADYSGVDDNTVIIANGYNAENGYVARFVAIEPGADGEFVITLSDGGSPNPPRFYANVVKVAGYRFATNTNPDFVVLDTNGDGRLNEEDDMYTPFYPGDDVVDWVGMSAYHWGTEWPWKENEIPEHKKFPKQVRGLEAIKVRNFYDMFCRDGIHNKPLMVSETAALYNDDYHGETGGGLSGVNEPELDIKRVWWEQLYNAFGDKSNVVDVARQFPLLKMICWFDRITHETEIQGDRIVWSFSIPSDPSTDLVSSDHECVDSFDDISTWYYGPWDNLVWSDSDEAAPPDGGSEDRALYLSGTPASEIYVGGNARPIESVPFTAVKLLAQFQDLNSEGLISSNPVLFDSLDDLSLWTWGPWDNLTMEEVSDSVSGTAFKLSGTPASGGYVGGNGRNVPSSLQDWSTKDGIQIMVKREDNTAPDPLLGIEIRSREYGPTYLATIERCVPSTEYTALKIRFSDMNVSAGFDWTQIKAVVIKLLSDEDGVAPGALYMDEWNLVDLTNAPYKDQDWWPGGPSDEPWGDAAEPDEEHTWELVDDPLDGYPPKALKMSGTDGGNWYIGGNGFSPLGEDQDWSGATHISLLMRQGDTSRPLPILRVSLKDAAGHVIQPRDEDQVVTADVYARKLISFASMDTNGVFDWSAVREVKFEMLTSQPSNTPADIYIKEFAIGTVAYETPKDWSGHNGMELWVKREGVTDVEPILRVHVRSKTYAEDYVAAMSFRIKSTNYYPLKFYFEDMHVSEGFDWSDITVLQLELLSSDTNAPDYQAPDNLFIDKWSVVNLTEPSNEVREAFTSYVRQLREGKRHYMFRDDAEYQRLLDPYAVWTRDMPVIVHPTGAVQVSLPVSAQAAADVVVQLRRTSDDTLLGEGRTAVSAGRSNVAVVITRSGPGLADGEGCYFDAFVTPPGGPVSGAWAQGERAYATAQDITSTVELKAVPPAVLPGSILTAVVRYEANVAGVVRVNLKDGADVVQASGEVGVMAGSGRVDVKLLVGAGIAISDGYHLECVFTDQDGNQTLASDRPIAVTDCITEYTLDAWLPEIVGQDERIEAAIAYTAISDCDMILFELYDSADQKVGAEEDMVYAGSGLLDLVILPGGYPPGNYTLKVKTMHAGQIVAEITQPLTIF